MEYTLITGASGGLGREFVKLLAGAKENLILTGTNPEKLAKLKEETLANFPETNIETFVLNLSDKTNRESLLDFLQSNNFVVTKLINNAGVIIEGDLDKMTDDEITNTIEVNCVGTLDITKKLLQIRNKEKKFEVLTVASQASFQPLPHMAVYAATKAFLLSMMTALGVEYKDKNVIFTTTCPSGMATTKAMKESIESMGFKGKITTLPAEKVAKISLKALKKGKKIVVPGKFNKFVEVISRPFSQSFLAKTTGKMWKKSQAKRNI